MNLHIPDQGIRSPLTGVNLGKVVTALLLIAVLGRLARPSVHLTNAAGLLPSAALPGPIWTDVLLPALLYLP